MDKAYKQNIEAKIEQLDAELKSMKAKAKEMQADAKISITREIDKAEKKRNELQKKIKTWKHSSKEAADKLQEGVDSAFHEFKASVHAAKSKLTT